MTIRDLIKIVPANNLTLPIEYYDEDNQLKVKLIDNITLDSIVEIHYHFWEHCNNSFPADKIDSAIESKDFNTFTKLFKTYDYVDGVEYLPETVWLYVNGKHVGYAEGVSYIKELFDGITFHEYECG